MSYDPRLEAFRISPRAIGIDLNRSIIKANPGVYVAEPSTTFRAGQLVMLNSSQRVVKCDGTNPFGFAKYTKDNFLYATVVGEYIQLNDLVPTNLKNASLFVPGVAGGVRVALDPSVGVPYVEGAGSDYTCNYINGQIARTAVSTIPNHSYVYVNYQYQVQESAYKFEGKNFWASLNDVDIQNGRIAVVQDWSLVFTTQYDPSITYAVNDIVLAGQAANNLSGYVTTGGAGAYIGRVFQYPTANDPFLGVRYVGGPVS